MGDDSEHCVLHSVVHCHYLPEGKSVVGRIPRHSTLESHRLRKIRCSA